MTFLSKTALLVLLTLSSVAAFAPRMPATAPMSTTSLAAVNNKDDASRRFATSVVAAAYLFANVMATAPATAWEMAAEDSWLASSSSSTQLLAASRSGGRAGGRVTKTMSSPSSSSTYRAAPARTTTVIRETAAPTIIMAPPSPVMMGGYGYNPAPGLGLGLGLSAINAIGEGMREARQENEIRDTRNQLTEARVKEAELEARLRALENAPRPAAVTAQ